jgi:alpha-N-arabinofuranosidase
MSNRILAISATLLLSAFAVTGARAQSAAELKIQVNQVKSPVSPTLYGLMTEEINYSYDGGLYAELIHNRTFRGDWTGILNWYLVEQGSASVKMKRDASDGPSAALHSSLKLEVTKADAKNRAGLLNEGYWGIGVHPNTTYKGSFYAKGASGEPLAVTAALVANQTGKTLASATVSVAGAEWKQYKFELKTAQVAASAENHFELTVDRPATLWLQLVSLFPPTYRNRPNGNRIDIMEKLAAMRPTFLRFPGGNYVEGNNMPNRFDWKKTIGPLVDRPTHGSPWGYQSTDGMGLLEFLGWCEDLKMQPVLAVFAGYTLDGKAVKPGPELEPYVQDALDEIEYVTGAADTKWGALRARDGHPAPFALTYVEVGNEDFFDRARTYEGRFAQFYKAIKAKYPELQVIATMPVKETKTDVLDDHYYKNELEMFEQSKFYDKADRTGAKIFIGEWATREGSPTPNFGAALGDAAWMTGVERNSDLIVMSAYAPLFVNVSPGAMQWSTDLIGYDALTSYGSPAYYAQVLFASCVGDRTAESSLSGAGEKFFYSATASANKVCLKLVNASSAEQPLALALTGLGAGARTARVETLHAESNLATNSISDPKRVVPVKSTLPVNGERIKHTVPAYTIQVIELDRK